MVLPVTTAPSRWLALVALISVSGCLDAADRAAPPPSDSTHADPPLTPSPGAPPSNVKVNRSAPKVGHEHFHNHWGDGEDARTSYVILDRDIPMGPGGACAGVHLTFACSVGPDGAKFVRFVSSPDELTPPNNVWPGTGKMTIEIDIEGTLLQPFVAAVYGPGRPGWAKEQYRVDALQKTIIIGNILENQTDPPHMRGSSWAFRLEVADNGLPFKTSAYQGSMHWKVTIHRSDRPLPLDPAHPDHWGDQTRLTLLDTTSWQSVTMVNSASFGTAKHTTVHLPDNTTVLPLSHKMTVRLHWANNVTAQPPLKLGVCDVRNNCASTGPGYEYPPPKEDRPGERVYELLLRSDQWDSPYATWSGWGWTWAFDNGDLSEVVGPTGKFDGSVSYHVEIEKIA